MAKSAISFGCGNLRMHHTLRFLCLTRSNTSYIHTELLVTMDRAHWTSRRQSWIATSLEWYGNTLKMDKIWTGHTAAWWTPSPRPTYSSTKDSYRSSIVVHQFDWYLTSSQKTSRTNGERIWSPSVKFMLLVNRTIRRSTGGSITKDP